jgi:hypothetical protein
MTKTREIHNGMDIIDSRDVIARLEELESDRQTAIDAVTWDVEAEPNGAWTTQNGTVVSDDWDEGQEIEYQALKALADEGESAPDWRYGEGLIRDSYFQQYAEELADDIGAIDGNARWPLNHIDWEAAAEELKQDYTSVDFDGETYWMRS